MLVASQKIEHTCNRYEQAESSACRVVAAVSKDGMADWSIVLDGLIQASFIKHCPWCGEALPGYVDVTVKAR